MLSLFAVAGALNFAAPAHVEPLPNNTKIVCNPVPSGTDVIDPPELRSSRGFLAVTLHLTGDPNPANLTGLCWAYRFPTPHGPVTLTNPPTLHLKQGDKLILTLVNELTRPPTQNQAPPLAITGASMHMASENQPNVQSAGLMCGQPQITPTPTPNPRTHRIYAYHRSPWNITNMHFHGLNTSPLQPGDDVVNILLCPRKTASESPKVYTYVVNIPKDEPPGTYWYHPHAHGESEHQVISQLTGAIIVDTRAKSIPDTMKSRMIIVRDLGAAGSLRPMIGPRADKLRAKEPSLDDIRLAQAENSLTPAYYHRPGGWPFGKPAACPPSGPVFNTKELLINGVPLPPKPNSLQGLPSTTVPFGQTQYFRWANTSADTILDVTMLVNGVLTPIQVTSRDAVPLVMASGQPTWQPVPMKHVQIGPAGRMEFYFNANVQNSTVIFRTRHIDTGCLGDVDLERDLMVIHVTNPELHPKKPLPVFPGVMPHAVGADRVRFSDLFATKPVRNRTFVFTEYNRSDEPEPDLYITELTNPNAIEHPYDMSGPPDVIAKNGTVEDWTILNYTQESHVFHIHQIHFLVMKGNGIENGEGLLLDTVVVPYGTFPNGGVSGNKMQPGAVKLRMDFRAADIVGTFVYHCHILSHEDNGMMAKIKVEK